MMPTGYEVQMYQDIHRIAGSLEQIAKSLKEWDFEFHVGGSVLERIAEATAKAARGGLDPEPAPEGYRPDNLLGNICAVIADREDTQSAVDIARELAEVFGEGDYTLAEDRLWDRIGPLIDAIQDTLHEVS